VRVIVGALNGDLSENTSENPASAGSVVTVFMTGAGQLDPATGRLLSDVLATVDGTPAEVLYAGAAPGFPGVQQINVRVPPIAARNEAVVRLCVGGSKPDERRFTIAVLSN
jgi:uncharacterized protein (TIGR03437 family)